MTPRPPLRQFAWTYKVDAPTSIWGSFLYQMLNDIIVISEIVSLNTFIPSNIS